MSCDEKRRFRHHPCKRALPEDEAPVEAEKTIENPVIQFKKEVEEDIRKQGEDRDLQALSRLWMRLTAQYKYSYNFSWMGRPIIQFPQDICALQELIWQVRPRLIVETGIAHGGSLVFYASMLELLGEGGLVIGIDIDLREHNRKALESHPMKPRIALLEGSSTDAGIVADVRRHAEKRSPVMVVLDSDHTHAHVLKELELYAPLVTKGSYLIVFDTIIEYVPAGFWPDRPWGPGNSPKTAVDAFLQGNPHFVPVKALEDKLLITVAPGGFLKRIKE